MRVMDNKIVGILFVCLGNICRSPALQGYLEYLLEENKMTDRVFVDSCGVTSSFLGASPDKQMYQTAFNSGIVLIHRAKLFEEAYFDQFDYIFAVDQVVLSELQLFAHRKTDLQKLYLATHFSEKYQDQDIPDPYNRSLASFELVWEMVLDSAKGILTKVLSQL